MKDIYLSATFKVQPGRLHYTHLATPWLWTNTLQHLCLAGFLKLSNFSHFERFPIVLHTFFFFFPILVEERTCTHSAAHPPSEKHVKTGIVFKCSPKDIFLSQDLNRGQQQMDEQSYISYTYISFWMRWNNSALDPMNRPFTLSSQRRSISLTKPAVSTHSPKVTEKFKGNLVMLILLI